MKRKAAKTFGIFIVLLLVGLASRYALKKYNFEWKFKGQLDNFTGEGMPYIFENGQLSVDTANPLQLTLHIKDELTADSLSTVSLRNVQSLNGVWKVEEGDWIERPNTFDHEVQVPGLMDMATPSYQFPEIDPSEFAIGPDKEFASAVRTQVPIIVDDKRDAFWYKRTFTYSGDMPKVAIIKIYKAKYHSTVWLNGEKIGENPHNFAPGHFDVSKALNANGQENELVVRIGASMSGYQGKGTSMDGFDIEKTRYYPGIYDDVELISSGGIKVDNIQISPALAESKIKVAVWLENVSDRDSNEALEISIADYYKKDSLLHRATSMPINIGPNSKKQVFFEMPFPNAKLWSPEDPNLYHFSVKSSNDEFSTRFGMRDFHFDRTTKLPTLNGKTTFLRGSNISFFRFAEDTQRGDKAWDKAWVRRFFKKCKEMQWNVLRTSIGPPPEFWYRVADEEGIMLVDEAPIWTLFRELNLDAETLVREYTAQLEQHWNYPSIIMWDAQNETPYNPQTLMALKAVRGIDMSDRAWDNGWGVPDRDTDPYEEHVYAHFASLNLGARPLFDMNNLDSLNYNTDLGFHNGLKNPLIINEYGWLWLQRDGNPTRLTEKGYAEHLPNSTADERFEFWNYRLAAITESMRARRVEGVMGFTAISHSFPGCYTSDNFIDLESLEFEPHFEKYMKSAFSPLGLCIWNWVEKMEAGISKDILVKIYNDDVLAWQGAVKLEFVRNGKAVDGGVNKQTNGLKTGALQNLNFSIQVPKEKGDYNLIATLTDNNGKEVRSLRKITVE